jgi:cell wall-associated NlpC family hydrolase
VVLAVLLVSALPRAAGASPIDDKKAQAERLSAQIEALGHKETALSEQYDAAVLTAQTVNTQLLEARARLATALQHADEARQRVNGIALDAYTGAGRDLSSPSQIADLAVTSGYVSTVTHQATDAIGGYRVATADLNQQQSQLTATQKKAQAALDQIDAKRKDAIKATGALQATLSGVKGDLAALVAEADARRQAAAAAQAAAMLRQVEAQKASRGRTASPGGSSAGVPVKGGAQAAVSEAMRQVGKPYRYGAAGPDSFDCSGLTLWGWRAGGVSLPHNTNAQYGATTHISMGDLQPGDLVYSGDMGHMAMYIGNGNIVEAPHTGLNVRVVGMRAEFVRASRP